MHGKQAAELGQGNEFLSHLILGARTEIPPSCFFILHSIAQESDHWQKKNNLGSLVSSTRVWAISWVLGTG